MPGNAPTVLDFWVISNKKKLSYFSLLNYKLLRATEIEKRDPVMFASSSYKSRGQEWEPHFVSVLPLKKTNCLLIYRGLSNIFVVVATSTKYCFPTKREEEKKQLTLSIIWHSFFMTKGIPGTQFQVRWPISSCRYLSRIKSDCIGGNVTIVLPGLFSLSWRILELQEQAQPQNKL